MKLRKEVSINEKLKEHLIINEMLINIQEKLRKRQISIGRKNKFYK